MYGFDHGAWMFGGGFMMLLWWLLPIVLVVALIVYFFTKPSGGRGTTEKNALDILKERYARGEIGKDEFEQKKRDLSS